jgi:hypothetical protein
MMDFVKNETEKRSRKKTKVVDCLCSTLVFLFMSCLLSLCDAFSFAVSLFLFVCFSFILLANNMRGKRKKETKTTTTKKKPKFLKWLLQLDMIRLSVNHPTLIKLFIAVQLSSAFFNPIDDCDEVFNFNESLNSNRSWATISFDDLPVTQIDV